MDFNDIIIEKAAKAFNKEEKDVKIVNRLMGGMSHLTYHIEIDSIDYTYRVIGQDGNLFVDRIIEEKNLKIIEPLGINNQTVYFDHVSGEKAALFVKGSVLTALDFHPYLEDVANLLKKLHHSNLEPASDYGLIDRLNLYETFTNIKEDRYLELKNKWIKLYELEHKDKKKVFCHNDAQRSNIVVGEKQLYLLDWEYAGLNEFYYDIASFGNVNFDDALLLLDVYLGKTATLEEKNSVRFYRMFQALQWHQVALRKEMIGLSKVLNFDFKMIANKYLDLASRLYQEIKGT
jgi:thiamine kinase-like enzyme